MSKAKSYTGIKVQRGTGVAPAAVNITSSSIANPTIITTAAAHGLMSGDTVTIAGHTGSTPAIDGEHIATKLTATTFSIPVNVTVAGTGGTVVGEDTYEDIAEVVTVSPARRSRNKTETSTHNDGAESNTLGIIRQTDGAFRFNHVPEEDTHETVEDDFENNREKNWRFVFPPAHGMVQRALAAVGSFAFVDGTLDAAIQTDVTLVWKERITRAYNPPVV